MDIYFQVLFVNGWNWFTTPAYALWQRSCDLSPPAAGASHSSPAKTAPILQSGEECTCHTTSNLRWTFLANKIQVTVAGRMQSAVILENQLEVRSTVAWWRAGQRVPLCQELSCRGGSVANERSMLLSSISSRECTFWRWVMDATAGWCKRNALWFWVH
jgi:hypothetical protein